MRYHFTGPCNECGYNWVSSNAGFQELHCDLCGSDQTSDSNVDSRVGYNYEITAAMHTVWLHYQEKRNAKGIG